MTILDYNRVLRDLNGRSPENCWRKSAALHVEPSEAPVRPASADEVGMVLAGRWYRLTLRPRPRPERQPRRSGRAGCR
jgi:uncharacterized protein (DUF1015 family)